ncbi:MAG: APC family permease [Planctomycetaceae bacterium]|nr:MAG: APC family permease [Planctomycetaceae bacterium]
MFPWFSESNYLIAPIHLSERYAISLSTVQLTAMALILGLTVANILGLRYGKLVQNLFTVAKTGALLALIVLGLTLGWNSAVVSENLATFWTPHPSTPVAGDLWSTSLVGLVMALGVAQVGSLFSADSWHVVAFAAEEVENPRRTLPLSMALGTLAVTALYLLANLAYLASLRIAEIQQAPADRVATAMVQRIFPESGVVLMSAAIMVSTLGCNNGLILAGARAYYAMARDGLFFRRAGELSSARTPAWGLALQAAWSILLVLPRTYDPQLKSYGNLYGDLLDYVVSAALLFYILTIAGLIRLRFTRPDVDRPVRAWGYPWVPVLYILGAGAIVAILVVYRPMTTWPGLVLVALGAPVYLVWRRP